MSKTKKTKGYIYYGDTFNVVVKDEEKDKEILTFTNKENKEVLSVDADTLLNIIIKGVKEKPLAAALTSVNMKTIPMIETTRLFRFQLDRDFKAGEIISVENKHIYPYLLAVLEKTYELCETQGLIKEVPVEKYAEAEEKFKETNKKFVEAVYSKEIKEINNSKNK